MYASDSNKKDFEEIVNDFLSKWSIPEKIQMFCDEFVANRNKFIEINY